MHRVVPTASGHLPRVGAPRQQPAAWPAFRQPAAVRRAALAAFGLRPQAAAWLQKARVGPAAKESQPAFPAPAWRQRAARPSGPRQAAASARTEPRVRQAPSWLPEGSVASSARAGLRSEAPAAGYGRAVQPRVAAGRWDAPAQRPGVVAAELDAQVRQPGAASELDAPVQAAEAPAAGYGRAVQLRVAAHAELALAAVRWDVQVRQPGAAARDAPVQLAQARPLAGLSACRRDPAPPSVPVRRRAERIAHMMRKLRAASRSTRSWQAARVEGLS